MDERDQDASYSSDFALRDGRLATMRLMRPDDKQRLIDAFAKLDRQSIYTRFFSYRRELPQGPLNHIDRIDLVRLAALVVTIGKDLEETIIGTATYVADAAADGQREAEVAFTIEEDFQGQGLASRLLQALAGIARRHGIARLRAEVLGSNAPMLKVFQRSGLPTQTRRQGEVVELTLDLTGGVKPAGSPA